MTLLHSFYHRRLTNLAIRPALLNHRFFSVSPPTLSCHSSEKNKSEASSGKCHTNEVSSNGSAMKAPLQANGSLLGCTIGDFSALWTLQSFYPDLGMNTIMLASMASGISTSIILETVLLRRGPDKLSWLKATQTAMGMSMVSMVAMELAENAVDYHLTGGTVAFEDPKFWMAAVLSIGAGFLAPLPYNYARLKKYGRSCH